MANRLLNLLEAVDVTELLPKINVPVLVMNRTSIPDFDVDVTRRLAAAFPHARLVLVDGPAIVPYVGDVAAVVRTMTEFFATAPR